MPVSVKHLVKPGCRFVTGTFARWSDGLYYTGKVEECDLEARRCLFRFDDDSQHWMTADEIHVQLSPMYVDTEPIVCCICDGEDSVEPNEIVICDLCQQGYHVECHKPSIDREKCKLGDEEVEWNCNSCFEMWYAKSQSSTITTKALSQRSCSTTPKRRKSKKSLGATVPKVKLDKKKKIEPIIKKEILNKISRDDVEEDEIVMVSDVRSEKPIEEGGPNIGCGVSKIEQVTAELAETAKILSEKHNLGTEDFMKVISKDDDNLPEGKLSPGNKKTRSVNVTRVNRKPKVAPAS